MRTTHQMRLVARKTEIVCATHAQAMLCAKARAVVDELGAELSSNRVPWRLRGALSLPPRSLPPFVDRAVFEAARVPGQGFFAEPTESCALDEALRGLVGAGRLWWRAEPPPLHQRPPIYALRHKSGLGVLVLARDIKGAGGRREGSPRG